MGASIKSNFRRYATLLSKNHSLHIKYMPHHNFLLAPYLA
jgi:hypothetical protein